MKRVILSVVVLLISSSLALGLYAQRGGDEGEKKEEKKKAPIYGIPQMPPKAVPKATPKDSTKVKMAAEQKKEWEEANFESLDLDAVEASTVKDGYQKFQIGKSTILVNKEYKNKVIEIVQAGVTFDCNNSWLLGKQQVENAIIVSAKNATVKNCNIKEYKYPIVVNTGADGAKITGNTIQNGRDGMHVHASDFAIINNTLSILKRMGISIVAPAPSEEGNCDDWENGGVIQNNKFDNIGTYYGLGWVEEENLGDDIKVISIESCRHGNTVKGNTIKGSKSLSLSQEYANTWASSTGCIGIRAEASSKNVIENNSIEANNFEGIHISSLKNAKLAKENGGGLKYLPHGNVVKGNTVKNSYLGIRLGPYVNDNTIEGNMLDNNKEGMGMLLSNSPDNVISNNHICGNKFSDINFSSTDTIQSVEWNKFSGNTCSTCGGGCDVNEEVADAPEDIKVDMICATGCGG